MAMDDQTYCERHNIPLAQRATVSRIRTAASWMRNRARIRCHFHDDQPIDETRWQRECTAIDAWESGRLIRLQQVELAGFTPRDGSVIHLSRHNWYQLPAGRYTLREFEGRGVFNIETSDGPIAVTVPDLQFQHRNGHLTPIDPAELERDRKALELRTLAPLRSRRAMPQADVDGLALFDSVRSPAML